MSDFSILKRFGLGLGLLMLLLMPLRSVAAQSPELGTFDVGIQLYENGNYAEAEVLFQQLVDAGYVDGRLFHNLASAQHKQGNYGDAILNYRRTLEVAPRYRDTRANLEQARDRVVDQFNRSDISLFETVTQVSNWLTLTEIAVISLLLWLGWALAWLRYQRAKTERQRTAMQSALAGLSVLLLLFVLSGGFRFYRDGQRSAAVVIVDEVGVMEQAGGSGEPLFVLHDGAEVEAVDQRGQWVKLTLPGDALQGWVSAETIGFVSLE